MSPEVCQLLLRPTRRSPKNLFDPSLHFSAPYFTLVPGLLPNVGTVTTFKVARVEGEQQAAHVSQKQELFHRTKNIRVNLSLTWLGDRRRARRKERVYRGIRSASGEALHRQRK